MTASGAGPEERRVVEQVFREAYGQALATLVRFLGDITAAEDAIQDAFVVALDRWRLAVPPNPAGWIVTTARNRAIDELRRSGRGDELRRQMFLEGDYEVGRPEAGPVSDDRLRLMFTCCHPALRIESQVALTLRLLGGLSVEQIARSFLVAEPAMAKRLTRAKYKIKAAKIPYRVPAGAELGRRLSPVLTVLYLIYNTGLDDLQSNTLRSDAIRLARVVVRLMPDEPEAAGLLALMLLNESRVPVRRSGGDLVLLRDQDRQRWDRSLIEEGLGLVRACIRRDRPGPFQLQASIQAVHCHAPTFEDTDWRQIVVLYDCLFSMMPTPVVALNRGVAIGEVEGPEVGLELLDAAGAELDSFHLFHAARGSMLRRMGNREAARAAYLRALELAPNEVDRRFLAGLIAQADSACWIPDREETR